MHYRSLCILFLCIFLFSCKMNDGIEGSKTIEDVKYTVSYESEHGSIPKAITVIEGTVFSEDQLPALVDPNSIYIFNGWYDSNNVRVEAGIYKINKDIKIHAKWDLRKFIVSFATNGGTLIKSQNIVYGNKITKPIDPQKDNYDFVGWYKDEDCTIKFDFSTRIISNITLYAKWSLKHFVVSFVTNGGTKIENQNVEYGCSITKPIDPEKEHNDFAGWYTDVSYSKPFDFSSTIICNITLYAKWDLKNYIVSFNTNGGTEIQSKSVEYGSSISRPIDPEKENYDFAGWYTDSGYSKIFDFSTNIISNLTLHAKWELKKYDISFNTVGGTKINNQIVEHGNKITKPIDPQKEHSDFAGWYTDFACTIPFDFETKIIDKLTLYAKWEYALANQSITISVINESDISVEVKRDPSSIFFKTNEKYDSYKWFLENNIVSTDYFYNLSTNSLGDDSYELYLEVEYDGNLYSYFATIKK